VSTATRNIASVTAECQTARQPRSICQSTIRRLRVTVDNADDDNDAHARDRRDGQRQPAVLEAPRDDVT